MSSFLPSAINPGLCDFPNPYLLVFSENVPPLVHYSHLPISIIALLLGIFVLFKNFRGLPNRGLFALTLSFAAWVLLDSVFWASNRGDVIMFVWSLQILFEPIIYISALYLLYTLVKKRDISFLSKLAIAILYLPVILFVPTKLMLYAFDETSCLSLEGPLATFYTYGIEGIILIWIICFAINQATVQRKRRAEIITLTAGITCLLLMFSLGNIYSSYTEDWRFAQVGLFTMPVFISFFVYSIVKYKTFKIKIFSAVALVSAIGLLNFSMLFIADVQTFRIVETLTLVFIAVFGYLLVQAVSREIKQREKIQKLALSLELANSRLKELDKQKSEFVSIASHQLRSPLTAIRGYVSMLQEGSYGAITAKQAEPMGRIQESAKFMAISIDDFLNVSRIESGNMKYELKDINLPEHTSAVVEDLRSDAVKRGLLLLYRSDVKSQGIIKADFGKMQQILHNLINNALKYTPKGTVTVYVHDNVANKRIYVEIIDTGIGMTEETIYKLFEKFSRAKVASSANIMGTGLGLFVAREMARAMKGDVTAHSDGTGKGSRFVLTLPLV